SAQRELQQAVCRISKSSQQSYYYVPQIWCLWDDNGFLVTSSQAALEETQRGITTVNTIGRADYADNAGTAFQISDKSNRTWLVPLAQCSTWLDFVACFSTLTDDFEANYYVTYCQVIQHPKDWQNLVELAKKQTLLHLAVRRRRTYSNVSRQSFHSSNSSNTSDEEGSLRSEASSNNGTPSGSPTIAGSILAQRQEMTGSTSVTLDREHRIANTNLHDLKGKINTTRKSAENNNADMQSIIVEDFHLFYWLAAYPMLHADKHRSSAIAGRKRKQKGAISLSLDHERLLQSTNQVHAYLRRKNKIGKRASETDGSQTMTQRRILRLTKQLFTFWFPLSHSSSMTNKYWGAVIQLLHHQENLRIFRAFSRQLLEIKTKTESLARILLLGPYPGEMSLPIEFTRAWIHLLSFWTLITTYHPEDYFSTELSKCLNLIKLGRSKILSSRLPSPLESFEAVLPIGIVSLLVNKTVMEARDSSSDIALTYHAYLGELEQEVNRKPYNRAHQEKLTSAREEINCVLKVLEDQETCVKRLLSALSSRGVLYGPPSLSPRRERYLLQDCLGRIRDKIRDFDAMDEQARALAAFSLHRIESNRDRQESAILIFTIVTIIFLPLSFVTSFFGMKTSDIRDMSTSQWLFWASAIPLTLIVLGISFFVAKNIETLKDIWQSLPDRWRAKSPAAAPNIYESGQAATELIPVLATGSQHRQTPPLYREHGNRIGHARRKSRIAGAD
ncbi:MAG: hypothetical protein Q9180_006038, partial [Flavoplaca navasiana]